MTDFETIYATYFDSVYQYVLSLCRDVHTAEEITQEAFCKAMTHLDRFDGRCRLYVWLCQIAKNTYLTHVRKQRRRAAPPEDEPLLVAYGIDLPENACWYTFEYANTTYTRPIVSHRVLDMFLPMDSVQPHYTITVTLLDEAMQPIA